MEVKNMSFNIEKLARDFSDVLQKWLTPEQMEEVNKRNAAETSPGVCHSHDFCDANEAMLEAYAKQMCPDEMGTPESLSAWDAAWHLARQHEFNPLNIRNTFY